MLSALETRMAEVAADATAARHLAAARDRDLADLGIKVDTNRSAINELGEQTAAGFDEIRRGFTQMRGKLDQVAQGVGLRVPRRHPLSKVIYAYGLRRTEAAMLDVADPTRNPKAPELGRFGACNVRYGKAMRGSPPRRRTVLTVMGWSVEVLVEYLEHVRPRYAPGSRAVLWPTERGGRIRAAYIDSRFAQYRDELGLPAELHPHCLRHSYVTHLIEDGFDPFFVQQQVGHRWGSTTAPTPGSAATTRTRCCAAPSTPASTSGMETADAYGELHLEPAPADGRARHVRHHRPGAAAGRARDRAAPHADLPAGHRHPGAGRTRRSRPLGPPPRGPSRCGSGARGRRRDRPGGGRWSVGYATVRRMPASAAAV